MIYLNEFDKRKIEGFVYLRNGIEGDYESAIECFEEALSIQEDAETYFYNAMALYRLQKYKESQEFVLKAINLGYDAYQLFCELTVYKMQKFEFAKEVLNKGIENCDSSACLEMARIHLINSANPSMLDPSLAAKYLELAYEYAFEKNKMKVAYNVSRLYGYLYERFPDYIKHEKEDMQRHYLKIFETYHLGFSIDTGSNIELFNVADKNNDYSVIQMLFNRFNGEAHLIFGLLMLEEEYLKTGRINLHKNAGIITLLVGALKCKNGACESLMALCFASDFDGSEVDFVEAKRYLKSGKKKGIYLPRRFELLYNELLNHVAEEVRNESKLFIA